MYDLFGMFKNNPIFFVSLDRVNLREAGYSMSLVPEHSLVLNPNISLVGGTQMQTLKCDRVEKKADV